MKPKKNTSTAHMNINAELEFGSKKKLKILHVYFCEFCDEPMH